MTRTTFDGFSVELPAGWADITAETENENLATIAQLDDGKGALQISLAEYRSGELPEIDRSTLEVLRDDFGRQRRLGAITAASLHENHLIIAAGSYHSEDDLVRVWYVSDRVNIALVTYVCEWQFRTDELSSCERIVSSFRFATGE